MPVITLAISPQGKDVKEQLISRLTAAAAEATGIPAAKFVVFINETPRENIGVGGLPLDQLMAQQVAGDKP